MRTTKNSKKIASNYMNSSKLEKIDNKKIFSPGNIVITTLNNNNIQIEQNDYSEEGLIKNLNDNKKFNEEEEYNIDMINQKYINNNINEEDEESSKEKKEEEYNYNEENSDNNNDKFNNNVEYINNEYINEIENNNENFDYKEYVYENMENLENDEYENNRNEEENNEKEKDEEKEDVLNEKYNLPLSLNYNKKKIEENKNEKKKEDILEYKKFENEIKNDYNDEIFSIEKNNNSEEIHNDNEDKFENNKYENEVNNNMKENEKDINYEDYILNTLSKLKKNNSSKLNKEKENDKLDKKDLIQQYNFTEPDSIIEQKKKDELFSVSQNINSYKINKTFNEDDFNIFKDNNSLNLLPELNEFNKEEEKIIPEGIKFGIDETGNPLNISAFFEKENKGKKLIAYIVQKNNFFDNYLVDTKGNVIQKSEEGDYLYKDDDTYIVIKDFDVKHPELRIFGHRSYMFGKKDKELIIENKDIIDKKNKANKIFEDDSLNYINEKYNNNFYNDDEIEKRLFNNNINKYRNIHSFTKGNNNFDELMSIWRERYGQKNHRDDNYKKIKFNNYSYGNYVDKIIQRTNSILKMASEKLNQYDSYILYNNIENKVNSEINYIKKYPRLAISKKYNIPIYDKKILNKNYENPLLKKIGNSYSNKSSNIMNNPLLKSKNILEKNDNDNFNKDIKYNKIEINTKNILNKNNSYNYKRNVQSKNNLIKNKVHNLERESKNILIYKRKDMKKNNSIINNKIYDNITKINELYKTKRNRRYSILSNEANEVIKDYNINHKYILNKKNIIKNRTFNNENNINNFNFVSIRNKNSFSINLNNNNEKNYYKIKNELNNKYNFNNKIKSFSFSKLYEGNNNKITVNKRKMNNRDNNNNFPKKKRYKI